MLCVGAGVAGVICWRGWVSAGRSMIPEGQLCVVLEDDFDQLSVDGNGSTWTRDVELGGFGNGEFQMTTASDKNLFVRNGQLYILPTLTSDEIGLDKVLDGGNYTLSGCTTSNHTACAASSSKKAGTVINPAQSARLSTKNSVSVRYGKLEVRAKLPRGDWLWPAVWMLPVQSKYGAWPLSGEIDIMEARGNSPSYPGQGTNFVRSSLAWGPLPSLIARVYGWQSQKRSTYASGFHTYTLEWTADFMKAYVDSRLTAMVDLRVGKGFWTRGKFPPTAVNGSAEVVVQNPYSGQGPSAPFDQNFYLILDVAVGGTSGWFPDKVGGKMWYDGSNTAMSDFANAQSTWAPTWPESDDDRAFRIDSVKMWKLC
ncbi:glycoside hydrolase family 16 protein [Dentipellis sp. KUC8613]|nr:glycoside hydrolase family 16 protein [Dentipellis sp. KUC8613]